jgi:hypothetical protein
MLTALNTLPLQKEFTDRAPKRKSERLSLGQRLVSKEGPGDRLQVTENKKK